MISVLILTFNEEQNIPACLESVKWCDDVLVVDSFSTDRTVELARGGGARVLEHRFVNFADQRNFGLTQGGLKNPWVLHLDADELVTPELRDQMLAAIPHTQKEAFQMPSRMMFQGQWLKYSGLYPWYQVRLGKKSSLSFVQVGHGQRETLASEKIGTLESPLLHYSFSKGIHDWVEKHNRYSTAEAVHFVEAGTEKRIDWRSILPFGNGTVRRRTLKQLFFHLPFRPTLRFLYMYCYKLGFLDGRAGLTYCRLLAFYEYLIVLKMREARWRRLGRAV
ncbi:MAG TPA: glycosyltransferase family 2 protein [Candidatus Baltobacteraceae bacterium]|jgi:glycosyltransferase involved in cell wall biosynthesis|nr:glycosyltransferase family 2 protein [Candidatus Baltobacteraceae bacterium]